MAIYRIKAPDGKDYEISGPENATQEQVIKEVIRQNPHLSKTPDAAKTQQDDYGITRNLGLVTRAVAPYAAAAGTGALAGAPLAGVGAIPGAIAGVGAYGLGQLADYLTTGGKGQEAVERGLTAIGLPEPETGLERVGVASIRGTLGAGASANQALRLANALRGTPAASTTTGRVIQQMGIRPETQAIAGGTGAVGAQSATELGAPAPVAMLAGLATGSLPYARVPSQRQQTIAEKEFARARPAGYVVPPASVKPTVGNVLLEGIGGKAAMQQVASGRNQQVTNKLAARSVGLPEDAEITKDALKEIRQRAGQDYERYGNIGQVNADLDFYSDVSRLNTLATQIKKDFPKANVAGADEINNLVDSLKVASFSASSGLRRIMQLRDEATRLLSGERPSPTDSAIAKANIAAADALEELIARQLRQTERQDIVDNFEKARVLIAKTYSVQNALELTGNVNAAKLATQLRKDKPLSPELKTAAQFAAAFPKATAIPERFGSPGVSALDTAFAAGGAASFPTLGAPAAVAAGLPFARAGARPLALSRLLQKRLVRYPTEMRRGRFGAAYGAAEQE